MVDKNKAVGVEFIRDQTTYRMMARKEVILSAGGIKSPQILMMSGIGPQAHLQSKGVRRKHFIKRKYKNKGKHHSIPICILKCENKLLF